MNIEVRVKLRYVCGIWSLNRFQNEFQSLIIRSLFKIFGCISEDILNLGLLVAIPASGSRSISANLMPSMKIEIGSFSAKELVFGPGAPGRRTSTTRTSSPGLKSANQLEKDLIQMCFSTRCLF